MPIEHSGNVASLTLNAMFKRSVASEDVNKKLVPEQLYLLFIRMVQSVKEMMHHSKDLDTSLLYCEVRNLTRGSSATRRLFFNREYLEIGYLQAMLYDQVQVSFLIKRSDSEDMDSLTKTVYRLTEKGLVSSGEPL
jgi:hypothetical protein